MSVFQEQRSMTEMVEDYSDTSYNLFLVVALFARLVVLAAAAKAGTCCCSETRTALPLLGETRSSNSAAAAPQLPPAPFADSGRSTGSSDGAETEECTSDLQPLPHAIARLMVP